MPDGPGRSAPPRTRPRTRLTSHDARPARRDPAAGVPAGRYFETKPDPLRPPDDTARKGSSEIRVIRENLAFTATFIYPRPQLPRLVRRQIACMKRNLIGCQMASALSRRALELTARLPVPAPRRRSCTVPTVPDVFSGRAELCLHSAIIAVRVGQEAGPLCSAWDVGQVRRMACDARRGCASAARDAERQRAMIPPAANASLNATA